MCIPANSLTIYGDIPFSVQPLNINEDLLNINSLIGNNDITAIGDGSITGAILAIYNLIK